MANRDVVLITILSNLGKMFPLICYSKEATFKKRLALSISTSSQGMFGADVLVVSMNYGLAETTINVSLLSLALDLLLTRVFIAKVKKILEKKPCY